MIFPPEIWDRILIFTDDLRLAILYKNDYVINKLYNSDRHTFYWCILDDDLVVFDFLIKKLKIERESVSLRSVFVDSIWFNNFQIAEYLVDTGFVSLNEDLVYNCCLYKTNLTIILFFERYNIQFSQYLLDEICGNCDVLALMYLIKKGYQFSQFGIINTVRNGNVCNLDILLSRDDIAYDNDYKDAIYLMDIACENYKFDMMKHLYNSYNVYGSQFILEKAAMTRSKQILKWVYDTHGYTVSSFGRVVVLTYFSETELRELGINI